MLAPMQPPSPERLRLRDEALGATVAEMFEHDQRLRGLDVRVEFDEGVAHLIGAVDTERQLATVRDVLGRLDGVFAVWDRVSVAGRRPVVLDLGAGNTKQYPENIGVDRRPANGVDLVADLTRPLPFADGSVDRVFAVHVLEHLVDFLPMVDECHRVLRDGGLLHVLSPWWRYVNAVADPTHVRLLDVQTIKGICARSDGEPRWYPVHVGCDGATVFADLTPLRPDQPGPPKTHLARFFD